MSGAIERFLTPQEEQDVINAISAAEGNTSGEIRVHFENCCPRNVEDRAHEIFKVLNMHKTKLQNAVLIYIAVEERAFAIYGDKGIDRVVADDFWECTKTIIEENFKQGQFAKGLVEGILNVGKQLKQHFPWTDEDENELTNTISKS